MKKAIIIVIIAAAAIGACSLGYFKSTSTSQNSTTTTTNKTLNASTNTATSADTSKSASSTSATTPSTDASSSTTKSKQVTNLNDSNSNANSDKTSNSKGINNTNSSSSNSNTNTNTSDSNKSSNQQSNASTTKNVPTSSTTNNTTATNVAKTSSLNIPSNFTSDQIQTLKNIIKADNITPGSGTDALVVNLDYYSVVNGQKYYAVYGNTIPGTNWRMAGQGPFANAQGNYSQLKFIAYQNQNGEKISQEQFLNGKLSFNPNNTNNLSQQDIYNMVKKVAIMYATYCGFEEQPQEFNPSELTNYNKNIVVNTNNTKNIDGETYYEVEYESGQPFYISLTGNIYVSQEHYLSNVFSTVPPQTNAQLEKEMKGI